MKLNSVEEAKEELKNRAKETEYYFAITLKENGKVIGEINANPENTAPDEKNVPKDTLSPSWMLNKNYRARDMHMKLLMHFLIIYLRK